jgi:hypothetical protein
LIVLSVIVYVLRQNCRAAGWRWDTRIINLKQKSLHGRYFKELEQPEINIQASHAWLKKSNIHPETEGFIFAIQDHVINTRNYKKHICGLQSIIDKCRICGTEGETIEHIISSCTVLAQSEYKKRHDIFAKALICCHITHK